VNYRVEFTPKSDSQMLKLRAFDQRRITVGIRDQLLAEPDVGTKNRKCLGYNVTTAFEFIPPLWELRIGSCRVFYEVDVSAQLVTIHSVLLKSGNLTTQEILDEDNTG